MRDETRRTLSEELIERIPEVIAEAARLGCRGEAWEREQLRAGAVPRMLSALIPWAFGEWSQGPARRAAVDAAAAHGRARGAEGTGDVEEQDTLLDEYDCLRRALLAVVTRLEPDDVSRQLAAIGRLDRAISIATRAALLGYHAPMFEARGDWPDRLYELCSEPDCPSPVESGL